MIQHGKSRRDAGSVTAELVIVLPVIMLTILACMQICLLFFAQSVALAAAQEGVRAARAQGSSHSAGAAVARSYATRTAGGFLHGIGATSSGDTTTVRVVVRGRSLSLVPFLSSIPVTEEASGAIERFTVDPRSSAGP